MSTQRAREFDTGQNWEIQKIRGILYKEKGQATSQGYSEKRRPPRLLLDHASKTRPSDFH